MTLLSINRPAKTSALILATALLALCFDSLTGNKLNATEQKSPGSVVTLTPAEVSKLGVFGPRPETIPPDPGNELSELAWAESLGESLFNDTNLSGNGLISCATCHHHERGFTDGIPVAIGVEKHVRNTQGLLDIGLHRWFGWDGGADSLWAATLRPLLSDIEMNGDLESIGNYLLDTPYVMNAFSNAGITADNNEARVVLAAKAIAAYTRTLVSSPAPFDDYYQAVINDDPAAAQQYPDSARRGLKIFLSDANCHVCHFGPNFSNSEFHDTGRPFFTGIGQVDPGRHSGIQRVRNDPYNLLGKFSNGITQDDKLKTQNVKLGQANFGQWRTPSLRNLTLTAPYTHDGSLPTLRAVVDAYAEIDTDRLHTNGESILNPLALSDQQRNDLVAFLESLTAKP